MAAYRCFYLTRPLNEIRIEVNGAVPSVCILMAHLSKKYANDQWEVYWKHGKDPLSRIGMNWPRGNFVASALLKRNLATEEGNITEFYRNLLSLGRAALCGLSEEEQKIIAEVASMNGPFEMEYELPGDKGQISAQYDKLPENYALPFITSGTLVFQSNPVRLVGLEFCTA